MRVLILTFWLLVGVTLGASGVFALDSFPTSRNGSHAVAGVSSHSL